MVMSVLTVEKGKGKGKSRSPRRSQTPSGKKNCFGWMKGDCKTRDACKFKHDPEMKGKHAAPSTPRGNNAKAAPAIVCNIHDDYEDAFKVAPSAVKESKSKSVKVNDYVEKVEYHKPDYVQCSRQRKKSSNTDKESRTWQQLRDDMQWVLQCKLGATRVHALAMLMDTKYDSKDVDEVHFVLGTKSDLKVRLKDGDALEDDPRAELFEDDMIPDVPGKFGKKDNVMCITMPIEHRDRRFIVDSGSGHDLISGPQHL